MALMCPKPGAPTWQPRGEGVTIFPAASPKKELSADEGRDYRGVREPPMEGKWRTRNTDTFCRCQRARRGTEMTVRADSPASSRGVPLMDQIFKRSNNKIARWRFDHADTYPFPFSGDEFKGKRF